MRTALICGAGIAGCSAAWWLRTAGIEPTVIERAPAFRDGGYVIDFWGLGYEVAERMGLLERLRAAACDIDELRYVRADGRVRSALDAGALRRTLGSRFLSLARGDLARAIYERLEGQVEVRFGTVVEQLAQDDNGVDVVLSGGMERRFDLVIGADGLHSAMRARVLGEGNFERYLGYYTASFRSGGYPRRDERAYVSYGAPGRQVARYALRDDVTGFLVTLARKEKLALPPHDDVVQRRAVRDAFAGDAWVETAEILDRMDAAQDFYFDSVSQIELPTWSKGRVALLGDAACCPSLLAGQGSAFAMAGAYLLAHELRAKNLDPREALAAFERRFRPFIERKQRAARGFAQSFAPSTELGLWIRDVGLSVMKIPGLGEWMINRMIGDRFELPEPAQPAE